tara:strand:- start:1029 stop:2057 length:1029 start_codon:yes stop_codon:yes gene_type:complete
MQKFFYILLFISTLSNEIFTDQAYGLKDSYDIRVELQGSDKVSINGGMQEALMILIVQVTGSSKILDNLNTKNLLNDPQKYISEYRLDNNKKGYLQGSFSFNGSLIRKALIENKLPLWTGRSSTILVYLPCLTESINSLNLRTDLVESCSSSKQEIQIISSGRLSSVTFPSMDLIDLNLLDTLLPLPPSVFMSKISKRYNLSNWLMCFNRNDFGLLLENPQCISSFNGNTDTLVNSLNELIDLMNNETQLVINTKLETTVPVIIRNVRGQDDLEEVLENIGSNILVKNINLKTIKDDNIRLSLKLMGSRLDFKKIMVASEDFDHSPDDKDRMTLRFIYKKRI